MRFGVLGSEAAGNSKLETFAVDISLLISAEVNCSESTFESGFEDCFPVAEEGSLGFGSLPILFWYHLD